MPRTGQFGVVARSAPVSGQPPGRPPDPFGERPFDDRFTRAVNDGTSRFEGVLPAVALVGEVVGDRYRLEGADFELPQVTVFAASRVSDDTPLVARRIPYPAQAAEHDRLRRVAMQVAEWRHPLLPAPLDLVVLRDGTPLFIYRQLAGTTLAERLARAGRIGMDAALGLARDLAGGLARVHAGGELHGALAPSAVMVTPTEELALVGLTDVGIGRLGERRRAERGLGDQHLALLGYLAPEMATGGAGDARADQFGLAAVLYHALGGRPPFGTGTPRAVLSRILAADPVPLQGGSLDVEKTLRRALAKRPEERFPSLAELVSALEAAAGRAPGTRAARRDAAPRAPVPSIAHVATPLPQRDTRSVPPGDPAALPALGAEAEEPLFGETAEMTPIDEEGPRDGGGLEGDAAALDAPDAAVPAGEPSRRPLEETALVEMPLEEVVAARRANRLPLLVGGALCLVGAVALGGLLVGTSTPPAPAPVATPPPAAAPPAPANCRVTLELVPANAHVLVDGRPVMPQDVELPRGGSPVALTVEAPGYVAVTRTLIPDADQHVVIHLAPESPRPRSSAKASRTTSAPSPPPTAQKAARTPALRLPPPGDSDLRDPFSP